ncbi:MAG: hypothetical protein FWC55_03340 [Firmicutes bacterium]|nr:hypothetical protein [Bacillota bacterium]
MTKLYMTSEKIDRVAMRFVYAINILFALAFMRAMQTGGGWAAINVFFVFSFSFLCGMFIILNAILFGVTYTSNNGYGKIPMLIAFVAVDAVFMVLNAVCSARDGNFWNGDYALIFFEALTGTVCFRRFLFLYTERKLIRTEVGGGYGS